MCACVPDYSSAVLIELELELIQTQMAQKPMLRAEVGMRVRCANKASAESSSVNFQKARYLWVLRTPQNNKEEGARAKKLVISYIYLALRTYAKNLTLLRRYRGS